MWWDILNVEGNSDTLSLSDIAQATLAREVIVQCSIALHSLESWFYSNYYGQNDVPTNPRVVVHVYNPSAEEAEAGRSLVQVRSTEGTLSQQTKN
jgi:hypothetical protein